MERGRACPGRNTCHLDGPTPACCRLAAWPGCCSWVPFACFARAAMHAKLSRFYLNLFFFLLFVEWGDYMYVCFSRVWKTLEGNELVHDQSMVVLIWASQLPLCVHFLSFFLNMTACMVGYTTLHNFKIKSYNCTHGDDLWFTCYL